MCIGKTFFLLPLAPAVTDNRRKLSFIYVYVCVDGFKKLKEWGPSTLTLKMCGVHPANRPSSGETIPISFHFPVIELGCVVRFMFFALVTEILVNPSGANHQLNLLHRRI